MISSISALDCCLTKADVITGRVTEDKGMWQRNGQIGLVAKKKIAELHSPATNYHKNY